MRPEKRRAGRAIRKQRRQQKAAMETFMSIDWDAVSVAMSSSLENMGRAFTKFAAEVEENLRSYAVRWEAQRRSKFEWRLAHRALETLDK